MAKTQKIRIERMADTPETIEEVQSLLIEKRLEEKEAVNKMRKQSEERAIVRKEIIFLEEKAARLLGLESPHKSLPEEPVIPRKEEEVT